MKLDTSREQAEWIAAERGAVTLLHISANRADLFTWQDAVTEEYGTLGHCVSFVDTWAFHNYPDGTGSEITLYAMTLVFVAKFSKVFRS